MDVIKIERGVKPEERVCARCGSIVPERDTYSVRTSWREYQTWCSDCANWAASKCEECGKLVANNPIDGLFGEYHVWGYGWMKLCTNCIADNFTACTDCGDLLYDDDVRWYDDEPYCPNHLPHTTLRPYGHTNPTRSDFHDMGAGDKCAAAGLYIGVEAEVECDCWTNPDDMATEIADGLPYHMAEYKEDGSLYNGVEIALMPCTPAYLLQTDVLQHICDVLNDNGATAGDSCGFHNHFSNAYLRDDSVCMLVDRCIQTHSEEWTRFARRDDTFYCRIDPADFSECQSISDAHATWDAGKRDSYGRLKRYQAVNLIPDKTTEIRLWAGTTDLTEMRACIEATAGLAIFCNERTDFYAIEAMSWADLVQGICNALASYDLPSGDFAELATAAA